MSARFPRKRRPTEYDDWCAGENDTCAELINFRLGQPGKDGLCTKHYILKAAPDSRKRR